MSAFKGLLKKDFGISRFWFLMWLIFLGVFLIIPFVIEVYFDFPPSALPVAIILLFVGHAFFIPAMLLCMLRLEGKTQLWLYNSQKSNVLLLSKIAVSFTYQLVAQLLLTVVGLTIYYFNKSYFQIDQSDLIIGITLLNSALLLFGLYVSCWASFYWTTYHSLGKFPAMKRWRWLVILILFTALTTLSNYLQKIDFIKELLSKGKIPVLLHLRTNFQHNGWEIYLNSTDIPTVALAIYVIVALTLFFISCWLLDRKVEV